MNVEKRKTYVDNHDTIVGFTRKGDAEHEHSGLAVLATNGDHGRRRMMMGRKYTGQKFYDIMGGFSDPVIIDRRGFGVFPVNAGSVSVWVTEEAYRKIWTETE